VGPGTSTRWWRVLTTVDERRSESQGNTPAAPSHCWASSQPSLGFRAIDRNLPSMSVSGCGVGRDLLSSRGCEQSGTEPADERNGQVHGRRCIIEGGFGTVVGAMSPGLVRHRADHLDNRVQVDGGMAHRPRVALITESVTRCSKCCLPLRVGSGHTNGMSTASTARIAAAQASRAFGCRPKAAAHAVARCPPASSSTSTAARTAASAISSFRWTTV